MIRAVINFLLYQTKVELVITSYLLTLLIYMLVVFILKRRHHKSLGIYMLKRRDMFSAITYIILGTYLVAACLVKAVIENIHIYLGIMFLAALAVNYLYVMGYSFKKFKDFEFSDVSDAYDEIVDYCSANDSITDYMTSYVKYLGCVDEDEVNGMKFRDFTKNWLSCIKDYLDERIKTIDYIEMVKDKKILYQYIKDKVSKESLWYINDNIDDFVEKLLYNEEVVLTNGSRIIPIASKRFTCLVYVVGNGSIEDIDRNFMVNTYCIMSLL